ncbi:MAG: T9SS type A sorting domain-containing protein, partial [Candidatus Eisenbacteria bacterium]|nr:T9SS type A sorting domain-containing protein [Candidatus Eisenbacteria bacterium]
GGAVAAAAAQVVVWQRAFEVAKQNYDLANGNPATTAATLAAMQAAAARLAAAQAALATAKNALAIATAAAAGFMAGTGFFQLGYAISDLCWDPVCDATWTVPGSHYVPPTDEEIEAPIPGMLHSLFDVELTEADFTGDAALSWDYMKGALRLFFQLARGAAAATDHRGDEVLQAVADAQAELQAIPPLMEASAERMEALEVVPAQVELADGSLGTLRAAWRDGMFALQEVLQAANQPPPPDDPCHVENGGPGCDNTQVIQAALQMLQALQAVSSMLDQVPLVHSPDDQPRRLIEFFRPGTLDDFRAFMQAVQQNGMAAVPQWEIDAADDLLDRSGIYFPSLTTFGTVLAILDAGPSPDEEAAIFHDSQVATHAEVLRASATTLSQSGYWLDIDLSDSPVLASVGEGTADLPSEAGMSPLRLRGSGPNPLHSGEEFTIALEAMRVVHTEIRIFDASGRALPRAWARQLAPGRHEVRIDELQGLPSGIYFLRVSAEGRTVANRTVLVLRGR